MEEHKENATRTAACAIYSSINYYNSPILTSTWIYHQRTLNFNPISLPRPATPPQSPIAQLHSHSPEINIPIDSKEVSCQSPTSSPTSPDRENENAPPPESTNNSFLAPSCLVMGEKDDGITPEEVEIEEEEVEADMSGIFDFLEQDLAGF
jgi:hypothetical protein